MNKCSVIRNFLCFWLFLFVSNNYADNLNIYGQGGIHKTQSAKTLGHGRFGLGFFMEGMGLDIIDKDRFGKCDSGSGEDCIALGDYMGANIYPFLSLGLSDYFDFSISIPIYLEYLTTSRTGDYENDNLSAGGWGDLLISTKFSAPFGEDFPMNLALILGFSIATGKSEAGLGSYGPWVRDPSFLYVGDEEPGKDGTDSPMIAGASATTYTSGYNAGKVGVAATFDFGKMKHSIPLLIHLNWGYRMVLGDGANNYPDVQNISTALELTPTQFLTLFSEFYTEIPTKFPILKDTDGNEKKLSATDLSTATVGISFHLSKKVDIQLGVQFLLGDENKYVNNLLLPIENGNYASYNARTVPKRMAFGGFTVQLFVIEQEEEWEEEYRNPDTDGDGVCDPWVRETGRQREFANICTGIDLCPYEEGPLENKGCPYEEDEEYSEPNIIFNVSQESVVAGQFVSLSWIVTDATEVSIEGLGSVSAQGSRRVKPTETTTYTITATGPGGSKTESLEIIVESAAGPSIVFSASQESIQPGQSATITWMVNDATEVKIEGIGPVPSNGSRRVRPNETTTYVITATGQGGTRTEMVEVMVESAPLPVIIFTASSESIQKGQNVTLNWNVTNATEVRLEGIGPVQLQGSRRVKLSESRTFTLIATGQGGEQIATVDVDVEEPPPIEKKVNLKGVNFLSGKAELTLDAKQVLDDVAEQLLASPEVKIEIHGHTDSQGSAKSNKDLSERRAKAVVGYLASKGVRASRMRAVGFGPDVPIADNKTAEGRELNRRIEMIRVD